MQHRAQGGNTSSGNDYKRDLLERLKGFGKEIAWDVLNMPRRGGFNEAAAICLNLISDNIEGLSVKIKSGNLSKQDQLLLSQLKELKAEMEMRLENSWASESVDSERS